MKRVLIGFLFVFLLSPPVRGAEVSGAVALTFDGCAPHIEETLDAFGAKGTFFLSEPMPEAAARLADGGHEIGVDLGGNGDMTGLSRRQIYASLHAIQEGLPPKCRPIWVRPPGKWGDGFRQVVEVTRLSMLQWTLDARGGLTKPQLDQIRSGDVIALGDISVEELSELISILRSRDLKLLTVTELAAEQNVDIVPGRVYQKFPVQRTGNYQCVKKVPSKSMSLRGGRKTRPTWQSASPKSNDFGYIFGKTATFQRTDSHASVRYFTGMTGFSTV